MSPVQFQLLKGAEEDQVVREVIRAASVGWILWGSPTLWTQVACKKKLGMSIPTVFQWNIIGILLNAVRIRRDNKDGVLHTTKLDIKIQSSTYVYEHCIYHVYTKYVHVCTTCVYMFVQYIFVQFVQCMYSYLWIHSKGTHFAASCGYRNRQLA
jgi:hypothetical protein